MGILEVFMIIGIIFAILSLFSGVMRGGGGNQKGGSIFKKIFNNFKI
jgi:hypothetical protein